MAMQESSLSKMWSKDHLLRGLTISLSKAKHFFFHLSTWQGKENGLKQDVQTWPARKSQGLMETPVGTWHIAVKVLAASKLIGLS